MKIEQLIKLLDAGFTKKEIASILGGETAPEHATKTTPEHATETTLETVPKPPKETTHEPATVNNDADLTAAINQRIEQLDKLIHGLQSANIVNAGKNQPLPHEQPENILASIITPNAN